MKISHIVTKSVVLASLAVAAGASQAAVTTYTSQAAFLAALGTYAADNFDDLTGNVAVPVGFGGTALNRAAGSFTYTASNTTNAGADSLYTIQNTPPDNWLSLGFTGANSIVFNNFGGVNAFGGFFYNTDYNGALVADSVSVVAVDQNDTKSLTNPASSTGNFFGFITDGAFSAITLSAANGGANLFPVANDLVLGNTAPVPEPEGYALMLAGLATVGAIARRRAAARKAA